MREPYELRLADGTTFSLKYSFKAIRYFEKLTGQYFFGDSGAGRIGAEYLAAGIAAGLIWRNPTAKADDVADALDRHMEHGGDLPAIVTGLMEALQRFGVLKGADEPEKGAPDRPTMPPVIVEQ